MRLVVFDSGVGGLSVARAIRDALPRAAITYLADTAVFPYGALDGDVLVDRVMTLMQALVPVEQPAAVVIACNTASTLVLPPLRATLSCPVVGTVPAVKPAAEQSRSRLVSVLATPATVRRDYTRALIAEHGRDCRFTLVGAPGLAGLVERVFAGDDVPDAAFAAEVADCFVEEGGRRTDTVVLACTHYPLVLDRLARVAPWPVTFIDPAPAIARRVVAVTATGEGGADDPGADASVEPGPDRFLATGPLPSAAFLARFGFPPAVVYSP
jgi:glutamate racemase